MNVSMTRFQRCRAACGWWSQSTEPLRRERSTRFFPHELLTIHIGGEGWQLCYHRRENPDYEYAIQITNTKLPRLGVFSGAVYARLMCRERI